MKYRNVNWIEILNSIQKKIDFKMVLKFIDLNSIKISILNGIKLYQFCNKIELFDIEFDWII